MSMSLVLAIAAVVAALVLTLQHRPLVFPLIALVAAGLEALMALHVLRLGLGGVPIDVVLGAAIAVAGAVVWARTASKTVASASTVLVVIGALQVLGGLHVR